VALKFSRENTQSGPTHVQTHVGSAEISARNLCPKPKMSAFEHMCAWFAFFCPQWGFHCAQCFCTQTHIVLILICLRLHWDCRAAKRATKRCLSFVCQLAFIICASGAVGDLCSVACHSRTITLLVGRHGRCSIASNDVSNERNNEPVPDQAGSRLTASAAGEHTQQCRNCNWCGRKREAHFEVRCKEDLKGAVSGAATRKDAFTKITRDIAEHVGQEFEEVGEFRTGMVEMALPPITEPAVPADPANNMQLLSCGNLHDTSGKSKPKLGDPSPSVSGLVVWW